MNLTDPTRWEVPVDSGAALIVDPANVPEDVLDALTSPNAHGVTPGVVVPTPDGDGWWRVSADPRSEVLFLFPDEPLSG